MACALLALVSTSCSQPSAEPLDWAEGAVWYQIFPERFRNGDARNDPTKAEVFANRPEPWQVHPWTSNWYKMQPWEQERGLKFYDVVFDRRYGGDLVGVIEKLDYLQDLGVEVIYFNPIFEAHSLHKYDASTYHHIDNNFGRDSSGDLEAIAAETEDPATWSWTSADKVFLELIRKAHERGIRIVIDGVFNHCGPEFWAFRDVVARQQASRYHDWFDVIRWDDPATPDTNEFDYHGWWGYKGLPEFKENENGLAPPVREYIFNITKRWMDPNGDGDPSDGIDGWRLDVAKDVTPVFWEEWYRHVKSINPDAITVGEIWEEAADWIESKRFDSLMNYPVAFAMVDFFIDQKTKITASQFDSALHRLRTTYPQQTNHILMNLIDSHDTDRVASMVLNPDRNYDRQAGLRDNPQYDPTKPDEAAQRIQRLIAVFQFTYTGAPTIYYGDEAGMWGGDDPDDRKPMVWSDLEYEDETYETVAPHMSRADKVAFQQSMFDHYQKLAGIRRQNAALRRGTVETVMADDQRDLYGFARKFDDNEIVVIFNNSHEAHTVNIDIAWPDGAVAMELLQGAEHAVQQGEVTLTIANKSAVILKRT